jgi:hypothetical protein
LEGKKKNVILVQEKETNFSNCKKRNKMRVTDVELNSPWLPMFIGTEVELVSVL